MSNQGTKHDQDKVDLSLISSIWILSVGKVLTFGAKKYKEKHNWRKGIPICRLIAAALRHIFAFLSGEDKDPETGESHLSNASCCLMFAVELMETRPDLDDRYKKQQPDRDTKLKELDNVELTCWKDDYKTNI